MENKNGRVRGKSERERESEKVNERKQRETEREISPMILTYLRTFQSVVEGREQGGRPEVARRTRTSSIQQMGKRKNNSQGRRKTETGET